MDISMIYRLLGNLLLNFLCMLCPQLYLLPIVINYQINKFYQLLFLIKLT